MTPERSRRPLGTLLPAVLREDEFATRFVGGLDEVLAPVVSLLDGLDAYLDARLAPPDVLLWLATWVAAPVDETWPAQRQRAAVSAAVRLHRARGTLAGIRAEVEQATGAPAEVTDNGGVVWSVRPNTPPPGQDRPWVRVRARTTDHGALREIVRAAVPAHVPIELEVNGDGGLPQVRIPQQP